MTDAIYVSSSAIAASRVRDLADECDRRGLTCLELTSSLPHYPGLREEVIEARARGLRLLIHNYFPPPARGFVLNLASADPEILRRSVDHCRVALELSAEVGAPHFSVHAGFAVDPRPSDLGGRLDLSSRRTLTDVASVFYQTLAGLLETADAFGVDLLVENNVIGTRNLIDGRNEAVLCATADDMLALMEAVPHRRLRLLLDVAHLKVSSTSLGFDADRAIASVRRHVGALHLSDNDGSKDDNRLFDSRAWFLPHLAGWAEPICVIETRPLDPAALAACIDVVQRARRHPTRPVTDGRISCL